MRFEPIDTFDPGTRGGALVVRPRRWPKLMAATLTAAASVAIGWFIPDFPFRYCAAPALLLLFALPLASMYRRTGGRHAWLLAADAQGLSVMLRSPLRRPIDAGEASVATFAWREVAWVRQHVVTRAGGLKGNRAERTTFLEIALRDVDEIPLLERIEAARATGDSWKFEHAVVDLVNDADGSPVLRLAYRDPTLAMRPAIRETLRVLGGFTMVREEARSE